MTATLLTSLTSPFARKVRVAVLEKAIGAEVRQQLVDPWQNDTTLLSANPLLQVPALTLDDGEVITNSDTILAWLERHYPVPPLWPTDPAARDRAEANAALAQGIIEYAVFTLLERRRPADEQSPSMIQRRESGIARTVAALEQRYTCPTDTFLLDGIGIACALAYLDFRHPQLAWRPQAPRLSRWLDWANARDAMQATRPPSA